MFLIKIILLAIFAPSVLNEYDSVKVGSKTDNDKT